MSEVIDLTGPQNNYQPPLSEALSPDGITLVDMTKEAPKEAKDAPKTAELPLGEPEKTAEPAKEPEKEAKTEGDEPEKEVKPEGKDETPPWLKAKITRSENKARKAEAEAAEARRAYTEVLARLERGEVAPKATPDAAPDPTKFTSQEEYNAAYIGWEVGRKVDAALTAAESKRQEQAQAKAAQAQKDAYSAKLEKARAAHDNFDAVAFDDSLPISQAMGVAIVKSDIGPEIQFYLGTHRDEAEEIAAMDAVEATMAIGRIGWLLKQPESKPNVSKAPKPITPVGSNNQVAKSPENETMKEYEARRSRELYPERFKRAGL